MDWPTVDWFIVAEVVMVVLVAVAIVLLPSVIRDLKDHFSEEEVPDAPVLSPVPSDPA